MIPMAVPRAAMREYDASRRPEPHSDFPPDTDVQYYEPHHRMPRQPPSASPRWDPRPSSPYWHGPPSANHSPVETRFDSQQTQPPKLAATHLVTEMGGGDLPLRSLATQSSMTDLRSYDAGPIENFSRPRKQSLRLGPADRYRGPPHVPAPASPRHPRPRPSLPHLRPEISSPYHSPYGEPEPRSPRARAPSAGHRPVDHYASPSPTASPPWAVDELRSSYRSQLSVSSMAHGNTERSSVLTKDSSTTSLSVTDEPSLEDVMGMYEDGFADDASESIPYSNAGRKPSTKRTSNQQQTTNTSEYMDPAFHRQPQPFDKTAYDSVGPDHQPNHQQLQVVDEDLPIPAAPTLSSLDAEIRRSKMFFFSPTFASSVAHLAAADENDNEKRDSGKSLDAETVAKLAPSGIANQQADVQSREPDTRQSSQSPASDVSEIERTASDAAAPITSGANSAANRPAYDAYQAEPEEPGSRDRYGFKKQSQHVTRQQYDEWDKGYSEYLARRKKKWVAYLKENSLMTDRPNRFPDSTKNNAKTKRFIRKGIPPEWRGAAWFYYAGGPAILRAHGGLYEKLLRKRCKQVDMEAIERDLHRTFPDNIKFKPADGTGVESSSDSDDSSAPSGMGTPSAGQVEGEPTIISSLRRVLRAFSVYNPRIGYCQSLNFLAGLLLLFVETEEQCFWLLNVITHIYLPGTHEISLEGSKVDLSVLMDEIQTSMPAVWDKIGGDLEAQPLSRPATSRSLRRPNRMRKKDAQTLSTERLPPITLCMTAWFMSCFIGTLPIETTLRVWDIFFYEGSKTLFRVALAIFKVGEAEVKAVADPMEMFGVVQTLPRRMIDANALMEACFKRRNGFGHLTQSTIDERRQDRRDKAQLERDAEQRKTRDPASGNVTEVESDLGRKNTLFGRKRRDMSKTRTAEH